MQLKRGLKIFSRVQPLAAFVSRAAFSSRVQPQVVGIELGIEVMDK
jgi:hypothetical protein